MYKSSQYDGKIAGLYDLETTLGSGHFAVVKLARHVFTGEKVAVKVIDKTKLDDVSRAHLFQEVRCMKLVQHPNVVRLYEVIDTQTKLYLILELGDGGDLYDYIMRHEQGLSESLAREYFAQIVRAISYCHKLHVVHRDLKPENVVFFERLGVVKLTDFGNRFCPGQKLETSCGSLAYSAPEILLGDSYDAPAVDVWSLGVILFMLVCGQAPFQEANDSETLTMIMDCKYSVPAHISEPCRRLIGRMLVREPEKRATLEQIASDTWLQTTECEEQLSVPLVSQQQVSEEDHQLIVQKMINGKIATKEEILEALEKNEYNHITATYFLLAERKLRALEPKQSKPVGEWSQVTDASVVAVLPCSAGLRPVEKERARKCSIVTEEEDDEDDRGSCSSHSSINRRGSRSEGKLHLAVQELRREAVPVTIITEAVTAPSALNVSNSSLASCQSPRPAKTLPSALSSPQLGVILSPGLGEIAEDPQAQPSGLPRYVPEQRRHKFRKTRTASCSSSDASDDDSEGRKKRGSSTKSLHRGGKDSQDPGGSGGGGGGSGSSGGNPPPPSGGHSGGSHNLPPQGKGPGLGGSGGMQGSQSHNCNGRHARRLRGDTTRLRESQSLNRITEVEGETPAVAPAHSPTHSPTHQHNTVRKQQSKRNALIGRYLSLQRKLCLPLWNRNSSRHQSKDINQNLGPVC